MSTNLPKGTHTTKWIAVKDISVVWPDAQRGLNMNRVSKIAKEFDPDVFGTILVAKPNGAERYHCIDGQHRLAAVEMLFGEAEQVPCYVASAENAEEAADTFLRVNGYGGTRAAPSRLDQFNAAVTAGYDAECEVHKLLRQMGYRVAADNADGTISAVGACMAVYKRYGIEHLREVLTVLQATFGKTAASVSAALIQGYAIALADPDINHGRLSHTVAKNYTPASLIGAGKTMRDMMRSKLPDAIAAVLRQTHDRGRHRKRPTPTAE